MRSRLIFSATIPKHAGADCIPTTPVRAPTRVADCALPQTCSVGEAGRAADSHRGWALCSRPSTS
eukprot:6206842-Pleurochrysis_carterae.AAC.1